MPPSLKACCGVASREVPSVWIKKRTSMRDRELGEEHEIVFHLTADEAVIAKAMLARGDCIFDVAYWFGASPKKNSSSS
jgi:hypothetical protein